MNFEYLYLWAAFNDLHFSRINSKHVRCYHYRFTWNIVHIGQDKLSHIFPPRQLYFYDNFSCYWKMKFMGMYKLKILRCFCHDLYNGRRVKQLNYFTANRNWKSINPNHGNDHILQKNHWKNKHNLGPGNNLSSL